jgi:hypothetical protein
VDHSGLSFDSSVGNGGRLRPEVIGGGKGGCALDWSGGGVEGEKGYDDGAR